MSDIPIWQKINTLLMTDFDVHNDTFVSVSEKIQALLLKEGWIAPEAKQPGKLTTDAFTTCLTHRAFNYNCHECLVKTVARLCQLLDYKFSEEAIPTVDKLARLVPEDLDGWS